MPTFTQKPRDRHAKTPRPSMRQIAAKAGVSRSTVCFVINEDPSISISQQTRQRVKQIAHEMGYQSAALKSAIKNPLRHIGFAEAEPQRVEATMFCDLIQGVREKAHESRYTTLFEAMPPIRDLDDWKPSFDHMIRLYRSRLVDGFIIDQQQMLVRSRTELAAHGVPVVMVNGRATTAENQDALPHYSVTLDDEAAAKIAITHLLELGHRRIAHIRRRIPSQHTSHPITELQDTYQQTLRDAGLRANPAWLVDGDSLDRDYTEAAVAALFEGSPAPTAIFAGDDLIALIAGNVLRRRGLRVPEDVSVIGYGNWRPAAIVADPPLTTVNIPFRENGQRAVQLLMDLIEGKPTPLYNIKLEPQLVIRHSTAPAT